MSVTSMKSSTCPSSLMTKLGSVLLNGWRSRILWNSTELKQGLHQIKHFNNLTPKQTELLGGTSEECGEVVQVIGKILRHGLDSSKPTDPLSVTNRQNLTAELADIAAMTDLLIENGVIDASEWKALKDKKRFRFEQYAHHMDDPE